MAADKGFVKWSPLRVWEEEKVASSLPASTSSSLVDITLPGIQRQPSCDVSGHAPIIGTLSLPSITNVCSRKVSDRNAVEVLGPVEHVPGQPISVRLEMGVSSSGQATPTRSRVLTMLFRRYLWACIHTHIHTYIHIYIHLYTSDVLEHKWRASLKLGT